MYKNIKYGIYYFVVHAMVEVVCFTVLYKYFIQNTGLIFIAALLFDIFAFTIQGLIGELNHKLKTLDIGSIGNGLMLVGLLVITGNNFTVDIIGIVIMAIGNSFLHEAGAISTTIKSDGKLLHSALFVAGGSFGLIIGQTLGNLGINKYWLIIPIVIIEILVLISNKAWLIKDVAYPEFDLVKKDCNITAILLIAFFVTTCRSFIGYAIPISWRKELWQSFLLFGMMGSGKAIGGYLSDKFGARKVGVLSTILCVPFLIIGKNIMIISIIGVFCFSLTMSITFGMLLSIINDNPGVAFGVTTVGLFIGLLPVFIFGSFGFVVNTVLIVILSLASAYTLNKSLK